MGHPPLFQLRKPHCSAKATRIVRPVIHDCESLLIEQLAILIGIQARMVKRLSFQLPDDLSVRWAGGEHQRGAGCGMISKDGKHLPLSAVVEMKEAVPCKDAVKSFRQMESPHICRNRALSG